MTTTTMGPVVLVQHPMRGVTLKKKKKRERFGLHQKNSQKSRHTHTRKVITLKKFEK
jgi:hypothetical protein